MVKAYTAQIAVAKTCSATANIGSSWEECWASLLRGDAVFESGDPIHKNWPKTSALSMLGKRSGWEKQPPFHLRFKMLANKAGGDMKELVDDLYTRHKGIRIAVIAATCHSDPGPLSVLVDHMADQASPLPDQVMVMLKKLGISAFINESLGRSLPVSIVSTACASALVATSYGADMIDAGLYDAVLVVALDTMARVASAGFHNIGAMTKTVCTPYDVNRTGTTVGEGAVSFLFAREGILPDDQVYGHITGTSVCCDAAHMVEPNVDGVQTVLQQALDQAGIAPADVAGVYWHGTGTKHNDKTEAQVSERLFGAMSPPCTSTKGALGHTMGASGGYNILAACETNKTGIMPHVASLKELEYPNLAVVQERPKTIAPGPILVTALGFGGINAAIVVAP